MSAWVNHLFWWIVRQLLRCRYHVSVDGMEQIRNLTGPVLVIPNHPAYIDPALVLSHIKLQQPLRPLVFSGTYQKTMLKPLMKLVDAFEVPDLSQHSRDAHQRTLEMLNSVDSRLKSGDCFLIYPSGRLQRGNEEVIGAARAVHDLLSRNPNMSVVMIRTRGLWGSMFGCAEKGTVPDLAQRSKSALGWTLLSGLFFLPRRRVQMHIEVVKADDLPIHSREDFNAHLENWYNIDGPQIPKFVRYHHFLGPDQGQYAKLENNLDIDLTKIKPKTIQQVNELLESQLGRQLIAAELGPETLLESIGLDSLDRMDLALKIETQFGFRSNIVASRLGQLWALADGQLPDAPAPLPDIPELWKAYPANNDTPIVQGDNLAEAFIRNVLQAPDQAAAADTLSGVLSRRRMLVGATLMAKRIARLPEKHIGIMLPASVAADVVFFAVQLAGKIPVMMNWTTGPINLAHGARVTGVQTVLTSQKLVDRLGIEIDNVEYYFLESMKKDIRKTEALLTLIRTYVMPYSFLRRLPDVDPDQAAVFLFTSGSESRPKTVPLTHRNLLTNIRDGIDAIQASTRDSILGFLPPFHSFGLTGNVVLPHVTGIRCVHYPDPTDSRGLVRTAETYQPSMIFTTPTFLGYAFAVTRGNEFASLRRVITGAEKCPDSLFELAKTIAPQAIILEGYGITECSPVVSANAIGAIRSGSVGRPMKSVQIKVVDIDTNVPVSTGNSGMLLVSGPSIFGGYYETDTTSPFVDVDGKKWYKTGDLVSVDDDGYIFFQGRLKRFLKAGGEMISLPALEEPLAATYPPNENGPQIAVEGIETEDGRHIVLFTTFDVAIRAANEILSQAGYRGVMRLDEVRRVPAIPVLGTGKTDYKTLRAQVVEMVQSQAATTKRMEPHSTPVS